jgi:hypothetical protein
MKVKTRAVVTGSLNYYLDFKHYVLRLRLMRLTWASFIMKIFGYCHHTKAQPLELYEATISAEPRLLRELSDFLLRCANEMEEQGSSWEHSHFVSADDGVVKNGPELIVFNPQAS